MIKKFKFFFFIFFLSSFFNNKCFSLNTEIEKEVYIGCYGNSKQYLGQQKAKDYCICIINKLDEKFSNEEISAIFNMKPEKIFERTEFATIFCDKKINQ
jgi:RNA binding exosome subunit